MRSLSRACSAGPSARRWRSTARAAAMASGCLQKVPAKNVVSRAGYDSSPYCHVAAVDPIHEPRRAGDDADRHAAADDLAVGGEVGPDAEPLLRAARRDAEAGDHLVEDQRGADLARDRAQLAQELARLQIGTAALHRLDEDRRELVGRCARMTSSDSARP